MSMALISRGYDGNGMKRKLSYHIGLPDAAALLLSLATLLFGIFL